MSTTASNTTYDVIVIGAGHAGCEAALASARAGCRTLMLTPNLDRIGFMPCNPSIGGPGKSHLVAEVDALGGEMARAADRAALQVRCLNTSKGPAVRAIRIQTDKTLYALAMKEAVERQLNLDACQDEVIDLQFGIGDERRAKIAGVVTRARGQISAAAVVVTAGTFLRGMLVAGEGRTSGGRAGERADLALAHSLDSRGFQVRRLKTGTPPRIDARTVDFAECEIQPGDATPLWLSRDGAHGRIEPLALPPTPILSPYLKQDWRPQLACFRISTNPDVHDLISANLHRAPMFNGSIEGIGPRYCPSIEDKVARFAGKSSHPIFLEPEGWLTTELYVQGMSTSLPHDVQEDALHAIPALRNARITRYGYAVEYDAVDPSELTMTLETRRVASLYFAGQINGTSGYEEAASQGIVAGINAAAAVQQCEPLVLRRDQAYTGVMIDDLVQKPFDEPYRMLTSRAEFRLTLRPSTADRRLASVARERGLIDLARWTEVETERAEIARAIELFDETRIGVSTALDARLELLGEPGMSRPTSLAELLRRPGIGIGSLLEITQEAGFDMKFETSLLPVIEEEIKYAAFVDRERREVKRRAGLEDRLISSELDYSSVRGLRYEAEIKLDRQRPRTIGEASRLAGVTPADIAALLIHTAKSEAAAL